MELGDGEGQGHGPGIRAFLLCGMDLCQVGREPPASPHGLEEHWPGQPLCTTQVLACAKLRPTHTHICPQLLHQRLAVCKHECCDTWTPWSMDAQTLSRYPNDLQG